MGALAPLASGPVQVADGGRRLIAPVTLRPGLATSFIRALDQAGVEVDDFEIHRPSLDDVFFTLTGHSAGRTASRRAIPTTGARIVEV